AMGDGDLLPCLLRSPLAADGYWPCSCQDWHESVAGGKWCCCSAELAPRLAAADSARAHRGRGRRGLLGPAAGRAGGGFVLLPRRLDRLERGAAGPGEPWPGRA